MFKGSADRRWLITVVIFLLVLQLSTCNRALHFAGERATSFAIYWVHVPLPLACQAFFYCALKQGWALSRSLANGTCSVMRQA